MKRKRPEELDTTGWKNIDDKDCRLNSPACHLMCDSSLTRYNLLTEYSIFLETSSSGSLKGFIIRSKSSPPTAVSTPTLALTAALPSWVYYKEYARCREKCLFLKHYQSVQW